MRLGLSANWALIAASTSSTDPARKQAIADVYRANFYPYLGMEDPDRDEIPASGDEQGDRIRSSAVSMARRLHEVPLMAIPCHRGRLEGADVFTQTAGIHADGDHKGGLYKTRLSPERFSRTRSYALGKMSGKA